MSQSQIHQLTKIETWNSEVGPELAEKYSKLFFQANILF